MRYLAFLLFAFLSFSAAADPYLGASFGRSSIDIEPVNEPGISEAADENDSGLRLFVGVPLGQDIDIEFGYFDPGEFNQTATDGIDALSQKFSGSVFDISFLGKSTVGKGSFYGRLGIYRAEIDNPIYLNGDLWDRLTSKNSDIVVGLGYEINFNKHRARLEYINYRDVGNSEVGETDIKFISAGIVARF